MTSILTGVAADPIARCSLEKPGAATRAVPTGWFNTEITLLPHRALRFLRPGDRRHVDATVLRRGGSWNEETWDWEPADGRSGRAGGERPAGDWGSGDSLKRPTGVDRVGARRGKKTTSVLARGPGFEASGDVPVIERRPQGLDEGSSPASSPALERPSNLPTKQDRHEGEKGEHMGKKSPKLRIGFLGDEPVVIIARKPGETMIGRFAAVERTYSAVVIDESTVRASTSKPGKRKKARRAAEAAPPKAAVTDWYETDVAANGRDEVPLHDPWGDTDAGTPLVERPEPTDQLTLLRSEFAHLRDQLTRIERTFDQI